MELSREFRLLLKEIMPTSIKDEKVVPISIKDGLAARISIVTSERGV
jgi:hypothetical protein